MSNEDRDILGVVAIGRNEGERLRLCLRSVVDRAAGAVYVDSGSTDGSVQMAEDLGVDVVELDLSIPFTAARARNAGIDRLREINPLVRFVQVVDGDCEVVEGWLHAAMTAMRSRDDVAVVCGRRRERHPDQSEFNRLCDMEWNTPVGEADACGGDALIRLAAFDEAGGFDPALIAGEEPEMCLRLRRRRWKILRIDHEMTLHDARMTRLAQWWKRCQRAGYASAEGRAMHGRPPDRYCVRQVRSIMEWAVILPLLIIGLLWFTWGFSVLLAAGYVLLWHRVRRSRLDIGDAPSDASLYASYCVLGKFPELHGLLRFHLNRLLGRRQRIIEYKGPDAGPVGRTAPQGGES